MPEFTVERYGTDTSGRPVLMTRWMHRWWEGICRELGFTPTIVQGAWMARVPGGGAADSAGYHDGGGCLDLRSWDLTNTQQEAVIHACRWGGAGIWKRDQAHGGMDEHFHLVLGSDDGLSGGAAWQWLNYINGGDGLSGGGRDYHPRPKPLVTEPPDTLMKDWFDMATLDDLRAVIRAELEPLKTRAGERHRRLVDKLEAISKESNEDAAAIKSRLRELAEAERAEEEPTP